MPQKRPVGKHSFTEQKAANVGENPAKQPQLRLIFGNEARAVAAYSARAFAAAALACWKPDAPTLWQRYGVAGDVVGADLVRVGYVTAARMARAEIYASWAHARNGTHFRWASAMFTEIATHPGRRASLRWRVDQTESHYTHFRDCGDHIYQRVLDSILASLARAVPAEGLRTLLQAAANGR